VGWFTDHSFIKLDITGMLQEGENLLCLELDFSNTPWGYERVRRAYKASAERNKLSYELEIEPCYIIGDFGVFLEGNVQDIDRNAFRFDGKFVIDAPVNEITLTQIEKQGRAFFSGRLTVTKELELEDTDYHLQVTRNSINGVEVTINGMYAGGICFTGDTIDCSKYLKPGKNQITLQLLGTLRNMMGPHHLAVEHYRVKPSLFYKEHNPWPAPYEWVPEYCFVELNVKSI
jgi:hypothetical protein